jgi:hypothetical protein
MTNNHVAGKSAVHKTQSRLLFVHSSRYAFDGLLSELSMSDFRDELLLNLGSRSGVSSSVLLFPIAISLSPSPRSRADDGLAVLQRWLQMGEGEWMSMSRLEQPSQKLSTGPLQPRPAREMTHPQH